MFRSLARRTTRSFHDVPSLVGAMVTFIAGIGVGLLISPWFNLFTGTPGFDALSVRARLIYGVVFLAIAVAAFWAPIYGGGMGVAFLAAFQVVTALTRPHNLAGVMFWACILTWTLIAIRRALRTRYVRHR